ncbi:hypothetical protein AB835_03820 [Candidatus Endobugula sertula]|uniref:Uncharacterized protein n=1 Tax=Candidatus Endobugula sertula TaxID=62101 RepID=A0A1D2QSA2_9GAMM|nr:hypothetical protein AB835_03820 [Candidatus Endobugula sertula]
MSVINSSVVFEENKPFSECALWNLQREFFLSEGVDAWNRQVPFYVTSNPAVANNHASILLRFMQDWHCKTDTQQRSFYILELGAGSGRFGFYALKRLLALQKRLGLEAINFVYVLTDFTQNNINYWRQHPAWQPFIKRGLVDFARYDAEHDIHITLLESGTVLGAGENAMPPELPCMVVANYVFDSLRHDIFRVQSGELYAAMTVLSTDEANLQAQTALQLNQVDIDYCYQKINGAYYGIEPFDTLLQTYRDQLDNGHFILPIGGLRCLQNLDVLCNNRYLLLAADKGDLELPQVVKSSAPGISLHGSFSVQVNFHALTHYTRRNGGDSLQSPLQPGIATVALLSGMHFADLPETRQAVDYCLHYSSPTALFNVYAYIRDTIEHCPPDTFVALMMMADWDPHIFNQYVDTLLDKLPECSAVTIQAVITGMPIMADHFYYMPGTIDTLSGIALFFQELQDYEQALLYYRKSLAHYGGADHIHYNMGLCYHYLGDNEQATEQFEQALRSNPTLDCAQQWLHTLSEKSPPLKYSNGENILCG